MESFKILLLGALWKASGRGTYKGKSQPNGIPPIPPHCACVRTLYPNFLKDDSPNKKIGKNATCAKDCYQPRPYKCRVCSIGYPSAHPDLGRHDGEGFSLFWPRLPAPPAPPPSRRRVSFANPFNPFHCNDLSQHCASHLSFSQHLLTSWEIFSP